MKMKMKKLMILIVLFLLIIQSLLIPGGIKEVHAMDGDGTELDPYTAKQVGDEWRFFRTFP